MTDPGYAVPAQEHRVEAVIERSRFIATVAHAATPQAARDFIDRVRAEFPDATHNCWAYVAGPPGTTAAVGMSDAGEPHGTAGRPMLDVLLHSDVGEAAVVVTRYYGGTKLGRGGLVRAYGGCVQQALASLPRTQLIEQLELLITVAYPDVDALRRLVGEVDGEVRDEEYADVVRYRVGLPAARAAEFERTLADRSAGRARIEPRLDAKGES
jgi:uncharacterized YigZ family protein